MKRQLMYIFTLIFLMFALVSCNQANPTQSTSAEREPSIQLNELPETIPEETASPAIFGVWAQPQEDELNQFLKEKVDDFSDNIMVIDDDFRTMLANSSYESVKSEDLYKIWEARFLEWGYGAANFDLSIYAENTEALSNSLLLCGKYATELPDAFIASYYDTSEDADKNFEELGDSIAEEFGILIDILYVKNVSIGDTLSGDEFTTFLLEDVYYIDGTLYTKSQKGIVFIPPDNQCAIVLEFSITNISSASLSYSNTGIGSASGYIQVSAVLDETYEYNSSLYVEDAYGYSAISNSFINIAPLESRRMYVIISIPNAAKELPAVVSIQYNGQTYKYKL